MPKGPKLIKVTLRDVCEDDLANIIRWRTDPEITRYMNTNPVLTMEGQKKWLAAFREDVTRRQWLIEVGDAPTVSTSPTGEGFAPDDQSPVLSGTPAGVIQLIDIDWKHKTTSWGYYVGERRLRSMQLALSLEMSLYDYVFDALGFAEIHNEAFSLNEGVIRLHQLCGCEITRVVEGEVEKEGVRYDITHLSITREKWYALRETKRYVKIDFDIAFRFHHIGYAVTDIGKAQAAFRKTGWRDVRQDGTDMCVPEAGTVAAPVKVTGTSQRDGESVSSAQKDREGRYAPDGSAPSDGKRGGASVRPLPGITADEGRGVYLAFMERADTHALIELVAPMHDKSPVSKILASSNGVTSSYHVCYAVDDLDFAVAEMKRRGYVLTEAAKPAPAFGGRRVAFLLHRDGGLAELLEGA